MKTIGLIGGMSWESTSVYYSLINQGINSSLHKNHSAKCIVYSFDFQEIEDLQYAGDWDALRKKIIEAGTALKKAGADEIVLCTNTMHKVVSDFETEVGRPLIHIADAVGQAIVRSGLKKIGLLGTIFTMEQDFYRSILTQRYGLEVLIPKKDDRICVNSIIYEELVKGIIREESRKTYYRIMDDLVSEGAQGIILGCTEIGLLVKEYGAPLFDSTILHAHRAVEASLE